MSPGTAPSQLEANKALVRKALHELFVLRDLTALDRHWADPYIQHNPEVPDGIEGLRGFLKDRIPPTLVYKRGMMIAERDLVVVHSSYGGIAERPFIAFDVFRVKDGKIVEHWDVLQPETPASESANGRSMFEPVT
jgi:predicted SnoaL-like aldol condensation-catalyzing enzyme